MPIDPTPKPVSGVEIVTLPFGQDVINSKGAGTQLEYVNYFPRQLLTPADMRDEREYFREKMRRHNRMLHGWGVVCGCRPNYEGGFKIVVEQGYAISPSGDEICIPKEILFDLSTYTPPTRDQLPCALPVNFKPAWGQPVYLVVCYRETPTRPVRTHPAGCSCGCEDGDSQYSRVREGFQLVLLPQPPESYLYAREMVSRMKHMSGIGALVDHTVVENPALTAVVVHQEKWQKEALESIEQFMSENSQDQTVMDVARNFADIVRNSSLPAAIEELGNVRGNLADSVKSGRGKTGVRRSVAFVTELIHHLSALVEQADTFSPNIPSCPPQFNDCCVVLARFNYPEDKTEPLPIEDLRMPCNLIMG